MIHMPKKITATKINGGKTEQKYREALNIQEDVEGEWISFAYPGKYVGTGETMEEAMYMAKSRYRADKKRFLSTKNGLVENDWLAYAEERGKKIANVHEKMGISHKSVWNEENTEIGRAKEE